MKSNGGYTTKFMIESVVAHPDLQTSASWTMDLLVPGTQEIIVETGQTIGTAISTLVTNPSYANQTVIYFSGTSYTSSVCFQTQDQSISALEKNTVTIMPDLTCTSSGSTSISFSIANYLPSTAPSWVLINSSTGALAISPPEVSVDTEYKFYVDSTISGVTSPVQKLIKLTVTN